MYAAGAGLPLVSAINFRAGQTRANNGIFPLGINGAISVVDGQGGVDTVHFIVDVSGYFATGLPPSGCSSK